MDEDLNKFLTFEVKKEMADRYFGFRKLIEEDIHDYDDQVLASFPRLEQKIGFDLVRIYILLKDETLIHEFSQLTGLQQMIFYDPYFTESLTIRKRVFAGQRIRGLTRARRFKNMIFDTYEKLTEDINEYRENMTKLAGERETIVEEIRLFYKKHDLGTMMDFLRGLEGTGMYTSGSMAGGLNPQTGTLLENKLRVQPPPPVDELLPVIPLVTPLNEIKGPLKKIIKRAYNKQQDLDLKNIVRP
jgi:hypothetical protein